MEEKDKYNSIKDSSKKWKKPILQTLTQREVEKAIMLSACSAYNDDCILGYVWRFGPGK